MTFGQRIKDLRKRLSTKEKKYTQEVLGNELGVGRDAISNIEIGRVEPSQAFINLVCKTYNVDRIWLETGVGEPFRPMSRKEELAAIFGDILSGKTNEKNAFIEAVAMLPDDVFETLVKSWIEAAEHMKEQLKTEKTE